MENKKNENGILNEKNYLKKNITSTNILNGESINENKQILNSNSKEINNNEKRNIKLFYLKEDEKGDKKGKNLKNENNRNLYLKYHFKRKSSQSSKFQSKIKVISIKKKEDNDKSQKGFLYIHQHYDEKYYNNF